MPASRLPTFVILALLGSAGLWPAVASPFELNGAPARPRNDVALTRADYPMARVQGKVQGKQGFSIVELSIDDTGTVYACGLIHSAGRQDLDDAACETLRNRARFDPARDEQGSPIFSAQRIWVLHKLSLRMPPNIDMLARVSRLPAGTRNPATVIRRVEAADGAIESCAIEQPSPAPSLDALACRAAANNRMGHGPLTDSSGKAVRALRTYRIAFTDQTLLLPAGKAAKR